MDAYYDPEEEKKLYLCGDCHSYIGNGMCDQQKIRPQIDCITGKDILVYHSCQERNPTGKCWTHSGHNYGGTVREKIVWNT